MGAYSFSGTPVFVTVGVTGVYHLDAFGAQGGNSSRYGTSGGLGAEAGGYFALTAGEQLEIIVGGAGGSSNYGGGGGGTFVLANTGPGGAFVPLLVAGGGGGAYRTNGGVGTVGAPGNGSGGSAGYGSGGGGGSGVKGNGSDARSSTGGGGGRNLSGGYAGGAGRTGGGGGGFGGGGGGGFFGGGGGGGYTGGSAPDSSAGGGGTSFDAGTPIAAQTRAGVQSGNGRLSITLNANNRPVVAASGGTTAATEQVAVAVDGTLVLTDDNPTLASATVSITGNFQSGADVLAFTNTGAATFGNIAGSYDDTTGVLTLTSAGSTATVAQFQTALRAVTYTNTSDAPNTANRTISFAANDGTSTGAASTKTVSVAAVNDAPTIAAPSAIAVREDAASVLSGISFADSDAGGNAVSATLAVAAGAGTFAATAANGVSVFQSSPEALTLVGTLPAINSFIVSSSLTFTTAANANGTVMLDVTINDGGNTGSGGVQSATRQVTLNITPAADTPGVTGAATNEDTQTSAGLVITRNAADGTEVGFFKVTNIRNGTLFLADGVTAVAAGSFIAAADGNAGLKFSPAANFNGTGSFDVQASTSSSDAGLGGGIVTARVTVNAVNDAPTATVNQGTVTSNEDGGAVSVAGVAAFSPGPANEAGQLVTATLTGNSNGGLFSVAPTLAANGTLSYTAAANAHGTAVLTFVAQDNGGTADGGVDTSAPFTVTVTVDPANDAPAGADAARTVLEDASYTFARSDFGFADPDDAPAANAFAAVRITTLPASGSGTLTLDGSAVTAGQVIAVTDLDAGRLVFTPVANVTGNGAASFTFQVQDDGGTSNGGVDLDQSPNTFAFNVTPVNDAPTATNLTQALAVQEDAAATPLFTAAPTVADIDSPSVTATLTLANPAAGSLTGAGLGGNGTYTISGTPAAVSAALAAVQFVPAADFNGTTSVTVAVSDGQNGPQGSNPAGTVSITVGSVNDAPSGASSTKTILQDKLYTFAATDFGFTDGHDSPADAFAAIKVGAVAGGTLLLSGAAVTPGQLVSSTDIAAGRLAFRTTRNGSGPAFAHVDFQVQDDGGTANGGADLDPVTRTITFDVSPLNGATVDVNGDGTSDIVLQGGGTVSAFLIGGGQYGGSSVIGSADAGYAVRGVGDLNGDGTADLVLQDGSGAVLNWTLRNGTLQSSSLLSSDAGATVVGVGDFNGDGTADILLQNGGVVTEWLMGGGQVQSVVVLTPDTEGFSVAGTGDFDGDGTSDILLTNGTGGVVNWIMRNGAYQSGNVVNTLATDFSVVGTGDFDGDGTSDVLLQKDGTVVAWLMSGGVYQSSSLIGTGADGYAVRAMGDYNGDGTSDIVLQNGAGVVDWIMGGGAYQSGNVISNEAAGLTVVPSSDGAGGGDSGAGNACGAGESSITKAALLAASQTVWCRDEWGA